MKSLFRKSKSKNTKNKYSNSKSKFRKNKNKKSSKKLKFRAHLKTIKKNIKHKYKQHIRHQKGGMGDIWRFRDDKDFQSYARYIFGSQRRALLWTEILEQCSEQQVPVFVITSGNRLAIERMLQLTEVNQYIREVFSIRMGKSNPNPRFPHLTTKAQIINEILKELKIPCDSGNIVGAFIDDQLHNFIDVPPCIEKIHALNVSHGTGKRYRPLDSFETETDETGKTNRFYTDVFRTQNHLLNTNNINYIPESILQNAFRGISKRDIPEGKLVKKDMDMVNMFRKIKVLILDCDNVISVLPEVFSFEQGNINIEERIQKIPIENPVAQETLEVKVVEPVEPEPVEPLLPPP